MTTSKKREKRRVSAPRKSKGFAGATKSSPAEQRLVPPSEQTIVSRHSKTPASRTASKAGPSNESLTVVEDTGHYVVVDKPALLDSQNSVQGRPSVVDWLREKYGFAGLVHRLDFGTSGLLVCAKDAKTAKVLTTALQEGRIDRIYLGLVMLGGKILPDQGEINSALDGQQAVTRYRVLERFPNAALVEVDLETGRKHQIRRHFSELGHPLLGDRLYGKRGSALLFHRPALHAHKLVIRSVEGERTFTSPIPADLQTLVSRLRAIRS